MERYKDIYAFVTAEETRYALPVTIVENYDWCMKDHVSLSILYKNSVFKSGKDDNKPFKNITRPILNLQYRAEGFDVKDIVLFVNDSEYFFKSFLVKKYHEKWARENEIDTFIDELVESYVDFGGALVKNVKGVRPEVVPLQSIAFCDQTDLMSGPFAIKHFLSPGQLLEMSSLGWGDPAKGATVSLEELAKLSLNEKRIDSNYGKKVDTAGRYIEVYEIHGPMPQSFLDKEGDPDVFVPQLQIVSFYKDDKGQKQGTTLLRLEEKKLPFKLILRDKIYGRALGLGGAEELFEPQVWTNYDVIHIKQMLDSASKVVLQTTDPNFSNRNKVQDMENLETVVMADGTRLEQINTVPVNMPLFERSINEWEAHAQTMGAANDAIMGRSPSAGTPFKLQELVTMEAKGIHEYRKGKLATFLDGIYREWIIPHLAREIVQGTEFLSELDLDELQAIADNIVVSEANSMIKRRVIGGENVTQEQVDLFKEMVKSEFMKGGTQRFLKILEGEMKNAPLDVKVNIVGKQYDLVGKTDKLVNVFRQIVANPAVLNDPRMAKLFNMILESSGLSPINFGQVPSTAVVSPIQNVTSTEPLQALAQSG